MNIKKIANTVIQFIINRVIEILGVCSSIIGLLLLIALISYSPDDPNFIFPENTEIQNILLDNLGVATVAGTSFGEYGEGYIRLSCANSDSAIEEAITRIKSFFN